MLKTVQHCTLHKNKNLDIRLKPRFIRKSVMDKLKTEIATSMKYLKAIDSVPDKIEGLLIIIIMLPRKSHIDA